MVKKQTVRFNDPWLVAALMCCRFKASSVGMEPGGLMYFYVVDDRDLDKYKNLYQSDRIHLKAKTFVDNFKKLSERAYANG